MLAFAALLVDLSLGMVLGVFQATRVGSPLDRFISGTTLALYATPVFVFGFVMILVFASALGWLPVSGAYDPVALPYLGPVGRGADLLRHLVLPALTLGIVGAASTARYQRAALLEALRFDFIRTARSKGLPERSVLFRHGVRNALLPIITVAGVSLPILLSGAVLVESVFTRPGLGALSAGAILKRDYPVVTGTAIIAALLVIAGNLLADLAYRVADPRTRARS
jgi:peptide/nickel transport system permease protein